ncbi:type II toxin-antitoxin system VapC family toxin [Tsukamurella sp. 1534]|uniref:type II toxin-antitoxin system VapC family toxin n=1 Tax=Tsukamurella sp. 1534 TaxID=1151061 RepID=UPI0002D7605A|nr:type II toxin-antitoxin system VapC family toxin [Tsukamurella sp. 1534]
MTFYALDSSVLLPMLMKWHPAHDELRGSVRLSESVLPTHVLLETFSVLTRLPSPHRISPAEASETIEDFGLQVIGFPTNDMRSFVAGLGAKGVRGGAIYDAFVGATAAHAEVPLLTRDRRAIPTYEAVGAKYQTV